MTALEALQRRVDNLRATVVQMAEADGISTPEVRAAVRALSMAQRELKRHQKGTDSEYQLQTNETPSG